MLRSWPFSGPCGLRGRVAWRGARAPAPWRWIARPFRAVVVGRLLRVFTELGLVSLDPDLAVPGARGCPADRAGAFGGVQDVHDGERGRPAISERVKTKTNKLSTGTPGPMPGGAVAEAAPVALSEFEQGLLDDLFAVVEEHADETALAVDRDRVRDAFVYACEHHADQRRRSGEDFIVHPVSVAKVCAGMRLDTTRRLCAALLQRHRRGHEGVAGRHRGALRRGDRRPRGRRHEADRADVPVAR